MKNIYRYAAYVEAKTPKGWAFASPFIRMEEGSDPEKFSPIPAATWQSEESPLLDPLVGQFTGITQDDLSETLKEEVKCTAGFVLVLEIPYRKNYRDINVEEIAKKERQKRKDTGVVRSEEEERALQNAMHQIITSASLHFSEWIHFHPGTPTDAVRIVVLML